MTAMLCHTTARGQAMPRHATSLLSRHATSLLPYHAMACSPSHSVRLCQC